MNSSSKVKSVEVLLTKYRRGYQAPKFDPKIQLPTSDHIIITTPSGVVRYSPEGRKSRRPRRRYPQGQRPSEISRRRGTIIKAKYGLMNCPGRGPKIPHELYLRLHRPMWRRDSARSMAKPCGYLLIFKRGERTIRCPTCDRKLWLTSVRVPQSIFEHDDPHVLKEIIQLFRGWRGRCPHDMISEQLFRKLAQRVEQKHAVKTFYAYLPWNLENFHLGVAHA